MFQISHRPDLSEYVYVWILILCLCERDIGTFDIKRKASFNEGWVTVVFSAEGIFLKMFWSTLICAAGEESVLHGESPGKAEAAAEQSTRADVQLARDAHESGTLCWWVFYFSACQNL